MIWRFLLRSWARLRDLGLLFLVAEHFWAGLASWVTAAAGIALAGIITAAMATAAATHAKAVSTENRVNAIVPTIASLNQGTFSNVNGATIQLDTQQGSVTLHCGALSSFTSTSQTAFLAGLSKLNHLSGLPTDNNSGSTWATGERGFINNCVGYINNIDGDLQAKGWMS